jgi:hypothetical protein
MQPRMRLSGNRKAREKSHVGVENRESPTDRIKFERLTF